MATYILIGAGLLIWQAGYLVTVELLKITVLLSPKKFPYVMRHPFMASMMVYFSWPFLSWLIVWGNARAAR